MSAVGQVRTIPEGPGSLGACAAASPPGARRSGWWRELLAVAAFYLAYSGIRDLRGDRPVAAEVALANARRVIGLERSLRVFREAAIQHAFVGWHPFLQAWDDFYGTAHFVMVVTVLVLLFSRSSERYRLWRNTLAISTALALGGFAAFPVMPPRLLPASYGFVDTLQRVGGLWSFSHGPISDLSDQYAAMPSLHVVWSTWCAMALVRIVRPWWGKALVALYPVATIFCVMITANHYFADAAAGLVLLLASLPLARAFTTWCDSRSDRRWDLRPSRA